MAEIETLIPDVYKLLEGRDLSETIQKFSNQLGETISDKFKRQLEEREPKLYLSNVGKPRRQLYYDLKGYKGEAITNTKRFSFLYGDILEALFLYLAEEAGHKVENLQSRLEYDGVPGRIDATIDDVLIDVKSCSPRSFEKFKNGKLLTDDPFGYISQLTGYWKSLKTDRAAFIAIEKVSGEICKYELSKEHLNNYDLSAQIKQAREDQKSDEPPPRCFEDVPDQKSGNRKLGITCSYCAHRFRCWSDTNDGAGLKVYYYSTGPRFLTKVVKEPKLKEPYEEFPIKETN